MLQKLISLFLGAWIVGHLFFRPQLKQLGRRIDRVVTVTAAVVVLVWLGQAGYLLFMRR